MFRPMRRCAQQLSPEESLAILERSTFGVLSVLGDDGYPYGVPLNYVYSDGAIYFHCAREGHKLDAIARCPRVCFTVVDKADLLPAELTTCFRSVIAFGTARILENPEEKLSAHMLLSFRFAPEYPDKIREEYREAAARMNMVAVEVEHLTGKEAIELTRGRKKEE